MKAIAFFAVILATAFSSLADSTNSLERFSLHFSTNTEIIWAAPTNRLPNSFWIYKRLPPRPFSVSAISNAVILASLQHKGFPKPSTNSFFVWSAPNPCGQSFSVFSIQPASSTIYFSSTNKNHSTGDIPDKETATQQAFECVSQFGLNRSDLIPKDFPIKSSESGGCGETSTNEFCVRKVLLSRKLDGVSFFGDPSDGSEGFSIEFGRSGQTRSFSFAWPNLEPDRKSLTASPKEIIRCIREQRVMVPPDNDETNYFGRIKDLGEAKKFTITKITPYYGEGVFGKTPTNDEPPKAIAPFAELEAVADFGSSTATVRLLSPIISSEMTRLLETK